MDSKSLNGFLFLILLAVVLLLLPGKIDFNSLLPANVAKSTLRWRLGWIFLGGAVAFVIVWGKKMPADKAMWWAAACAVLAYLFL